MIKTAIAAIVAAPAITIGALFFAPAANALNPVDCAFNPATAKAHAKDCAGVTVESVASNGGNVNAQGGVDDDIHTPQ